MNPETAMDSVKLAQENTDLKNDLITMTQTRQASQREAFFKCLESLDMLSIALTGDKEVSVKRLIEIVNRDRKQLEATHAGLLAVKNLIENSTGIVKSYGQMVPWATLRTGGFMEDWLIKFDHALTLAKERQTTLSGSSQAASEV